MTVRSDKRSIKSDITCLKRRNERKLCTYKVLLGDAVCIVEDRKNGELDLFGYVLIVVRKSANEYIECLTCDSRAERLA